MFAFLSIDAEPTRRDFRSGSGFTLIELMIVMSLLAVMSLAVTPVFRGGFSGVRADHSMRDLLAAMQRAQADAITEAVEHRVYFQPDENIYWLERATLSRRGEIGYKVLDGRDGRFIELPRDVVLEQPEARIGEGAGTYYVAFYPSGACDIALVTVALANDSRSVYTFETTGTRIEFEEPLP